MDRSQEGDSPWSPWSVAFVGLAVVATLVAAYHVVVHRAPLLPTILGQYSLLVASVLFGLVGYRLSTRASTATGRTTVHVHGVGGFLVAGAASVLYATHQLLSPVVGFPAEGVLFQALFVADIGGLAGLYAGREVARSERTIADLEQERALTRSIDEALPDALYLFDADGDFLRWNDEFRAATGYDDGEIATMSPVEFVAERDRADVAAAIEAALSGEGPVTVEAHFRRKDGEEVPYEFTGARLDDGRETPAVVGVGRDVSERRARERQVEAVFDNTYQFTGLLDPDGTVRGVNETALSFGGLDRSEVVGERLWSVDWFRGDPERREAVRRAVDRARDGEFVRDKLRVRGAVREAVVDFSVRPVEDDAGTVRSLVVEGRDVTELRRRREHLDVLHRFLRHDLRNGLNVVRGFADRLVDSLDDRTDVDHAGRIRETAVDLHRSSELVKDLSESVADREFEGRPLELSTVVETAVSEAAVPDDDDVDVRVPATDGGDDGSEEPVVTADQGLSTAFAELLDVAFEHGTAEARVSVADGFPDGDDHVAVDVECRDCDIPDQELSALDDPETRSNTRHPTGLSLWLVASTVESYGGTVDYEVGDADVTVEVRMPRADAVAVPA